MDKLGKALEGIKKTVAIENKTDVPSPVIDILNKQIYNELYSSQLYNAMSAWFDNAGYPNLSKKFLEYGKEELTHMYKIYDYLYERNVRVVVPNAETCGCTFSGCREIIEKALEHEFGVTQNWNDIARVALSNNDFMTLHYTDWFLGEQREEESKFRDMLFDLNMGLPEWRLEEKAG